MNEVDKYLQELDHPLKPLVVKLRKVIRDAVPGLEENIKWNAPNFVHKGVDRITMKLYPPRQVQVILHRGTGKKEVLKKHLINDDRGLLTWAANDRAFTGFRNEKELKEKELDLVEVIREWLKVPVKE